MQTPPTDPAVQHGSATRSGLPAQILDTEAAVDPELQAALDALQMVSSGDLNGALEAALDVHRRLRVRLGDVTDS